MDVAGGEQAAGRREVVVRPAAQPGDLGWVVMAHGEVYARQLGWDQGFEALVARIVADFANDHDDARERAWVAEVDGRRVGSIMLVADAEPDVARLRILLVTPDGRGAGLGSRLVRESVAFARAAGYRAVTLWTDGGLGAARRIYEAAGFVLRASEPHHSFGHDLVGETWTLELE